MRFQVFWGVFLSSWFTCCWHEVINFISHSFHDFCDTEVDMQNLVVRSVSKIAFLKMLRHRLIIRALLERVILYTSLTKLCPFVYFMFNWIQYTDVANVQNLWGHFQGKLIVCLFTLLFIQSFCCLQELLCICGCLSLNLLTSIASSSVDGQL